MSDTYKDILNEIDAELDVDDLVNKDLSELLKIASSMNIRQVDDNTPATVLIEAIMDAVEFDSMLDLGQIDLKVSEDVS